MVEWVVRGVCVQVRFGFFAVLAVLCLTGLPMAAVGAACACHELAHLLCMTALNLPPARISFSGGGILISPMRNRLLSRPKELLILLCGPMVNLLLGGMFLWLGLRGAGCIQLAVGLWNLLPVPALDGGSALCCACGTLRCGKGADRLLGHLGGAAVLLFAVCLWKVLPDGRLPALVLGWMGLCTLANPTGM